MDALPLFPVWLVDIVGSALIIIIGWASFNLARKSKDRDPDNALWLFLYCLTGALLAFSLSRALGHILGHVLVFSGHESFWQQIRPYSGGLNAIISIVVASITLFFHNSQKLYRRMTADHHRMAATSQEILTLNREMEALVMERTMSEMALGIADGIRNPLLVIGGFSHRLLKKTAPDDPTREWAKAISDEAKHLEQMVGHFEALAEKKEAFFGQEDLNSIVRDILEILAPEMEKKAIHLVSGFSSRPIVGRLNKHLLKVAIAHLVRNAIEATPHGEIRVDYLGGAPSGRVDHPGHRPGHGSGGGRQGLRAVLYHQGGRLRFRHGFCSIRSLRSTGARLPWTARWARAPR